MDADQRTGRRIGIVDTPAAAASWRWVVSSLGTAATATTHRGLLPDAAAGIPAIRVITDG